jgi:hypothetical protein
MLHLTQEPTDRYDFSNLRGYQFVNEGILCLLTLLYIYHYTQCLMDAVVNYLLLILL